ncbi:MAG: hypothetical protein AB7E67_10650 [Xanthobacteraceae bacterium]
MHKSISFDLRFIYRLILWSTLAVIGLGLFREAFVHVFGFETPLKDLRHISLEEKHSLQAWQQSSLALLAAAIAGALSASEGPELRRYWFVLACGLTFVSLDQQVTIHQSTIVFLKKLHEFDGFLYFPWVMWALPLCVATGIWFVPFLLKIPRRFAVAFVLSGGTFLGAAVGLELLGGKFVSAYGRDSWQYMLEFIMEESLESVGLAMVTVALLEYWQVTRAGAAIYATGGFKILSGPHTRIIPHALAKFRKTASRTLASDISIDRRIPGTDRRSR